jgi:hypothetical protein
LSVTPFETQQHKNNNTPHADIVYGERNNTKCGAQYNNKKCDSQLQQHSMLNIVMLSVAKEPISLSVVILSVMAPDVFAKMPFYYLT